MPKEPIHPLMLALRPYLNAWGWDHPDRVLAVLAEHTQALEAGVAEERSLRQGCRLDTDGDGNCPIHPAGCPTERLIDLLGIGTAPDPVMPQPETMACEGCGEPADPPHYTADDVRLCGACYDLDHELGDVEPTDDPMRGLPDVGDIEDHYRDGGDR